MSDLTEFLLARIAEDEREAGDADEARLWQWSQHGHMIIADAGHMQRFTPSRMLRECEAKRRIVDEHARHKGDCDRDYQYGDHPCSTLRALASAYSDHPHYDPAWSA